MKKFLLHLAVASLLIAATANASSTLAPNADTEQLGFTSNWGATGFSTAPTTQDYAGGDVQILRFTIEGHAENVIDEIVVTGRTTNSPTSAYVTTLSLSLSYGDEITESQSLSLSGTPEPSRTALLAAGLCAFTLRRRRK